MSDQNRQQQSSNAPPWAYLLVAAGGGVVGQDYARSLNVEPLVGAALGAVVSAAITAFLYALLSNKEEIKNFLMGAGAFLGAILGFQVAKTNPDPDQPWWIPTLVCAAVGAGIGRIAAALIFLAAILLLIASQGPVGFFIRSIIMGSNEQ